MTLIRVFSMTSQIRLVDWRQRIEHVSKGMPKQEISFLKFFIFLLFLLSFLLFFSFFSNFIFFGIIIFYNFCTNIYLFLFFVTSLKKSGGFGWAKDKIHENR